MSIHKILVATDFTEASDAAIESALDLASRLGASVTLAHTYELPTYGIGDPNLVMPMVEVASDLSRTLEQTMENEVETRRYRGVPLAINAVAEEIGADLIIVGTHGRTGLAHVLLGSTAESIVRGATRAVMIVRSGAPPLEQDTHARQGTGPGRAA